MIFESKVTEMAFDTAHYYHLFVYRKHEPGLCNNANNIAAHISFTLQLWDDDKQTKQKLRDRKRALTKDSVVFI